MNVTPEFWTPEELSEEKINDICEWLMAWQKACVMYDSLAGDVLELTLPANKGLDPAFLRAMHHVESLVRHLHALRLKNE
jgi:hypothetical protein